MRHFICISIFISFFSIQSFCQAPPAPADVPPSMDMDMPPAPPSLEINDIESIKKNYSNKLSKIDQLLVGKWKPINSELKGFVEFKNDMMYDGMNPRRQAVGMKFRLYDTNQCSVPGNIYQKNLEATEALAWLEDTRASCIRVIKINDKELTLGFLYKSAGVLELKKVE